MLLTMTNGEKYSRKLKIAHCSALLNQGVEELKVVISNELSENTANTDIIVANARHAQALNDAAESLKSLSTALRDGIPTDLAAQDLRQAIYTLSTITGTITTPEILQNIFSNFCVGK